VIATARRVETLSDLEVMGMSVLPLDITSQESIDNAKTKVAALTGGKLNVLVNNA
jgi:1-acylglycerone phosphate reductase